MNKKEYMVKIWGGAWNDNANPSIEKDLGIKEGYHYFDTEKDDFLSLLHNPIYWNQGIAIDNYYGFLSHKKTIFVETFRYKEKEYVLHYDFGYEFPEKSAIYLFTEGNYSCDCNRSLFIQREYGEDAIQELDCGEEIELVEYHIEYVD